MHENKQEVIKAVSLVKMIENLSSVSRPIYDTGKADGDFR